ncbi:UNVERIFIED_CONTAM: hypothetical protein Sradi_1913000 [Sesamum radiatum]|uniref:Uncharacterized protein n=1 Tax=Sesamum radiatum TaxID=300843 RepID=A0AAW2U1U1_SESRA
MGQSRYQPQESYPTPNSEMSLEEIVKSLELSTQQFYKDTKANLQEKKVNSQDLGDQLSQLATSVGQLETQTSKELPAQTETHPVENVSTMTLGGEKELHMIEQAPMDAKEDKKTLEDTEAQDKNVESDLILVPSANICVLSSPYRMPKSKNDEKEILNTSLKVKINTPVLELKALPYHLQCLYLGVSETLSDIIFQGLVKEQYELKLDEKEVLRSSKEKTQGFADFIILKKLLRLGRKCYSTNFA